jgi:hypothetical protein
MLMLLCCCCADDDNDGDEEDDNDDGDDDDVLIFDLLVSYAATLSLFLLNDTCWSCSFPLIDAFHAASIRGAVISKLAL